MVRINILKDGSVTGDVSRIIAYEGQQYSEDIKFTYPAIGGEYIKYVSYTWGSTRFENMLDYDDKVRLLVCGSGIVSVQFYAKNPITGDIGLMSKPFDLIIHKSLPSGPDFSANCYRNGCGHVPNPPSGDMGVAEQLVKFALELAQEQEVRAAQDSQIWEEIFNIKNKLAEAGINTTDPTATIEDCNRLLDSGEYHLKEKSLNTPDGEGESTDPWIVQVRTYGAQVLQTAYSADDGDTRVSYRTGTIIPDSDTYWLNWIPMVHETEVREV